MCKANVMTYDENFGTLVNIVLISAATIQQ